MKVLIIEDEQQSANILINFLKKFDNNIFILDILKSVESGINWLNNNDVPDLIFADVHLQDGVCFQVFEEFKLKIPVIFTTAFDNYAINAFKLNSVDYLLKPFSYEDLVDAVNKFLTNKNYFFNNADFYSAHQLNKKEYKNKFLVNVGAKLQIIKVKEILYFYSEHKTTYLITNDHVNIPIELSLDKLGTIVNPEIFFRINRQSLVNIEAINQVHIYSKGKLKVEISTQNKHEFLVSSDKITDFKKWLDS